MKAYLVSVSDSEHTLELAAALLDEGVLPEDISVVVDESIAGRVNGHHLEGGNPRIEADLIAEGAQSNGVNYAATRNPEMERSIEALGENPAPLYESEIGGGISTDTPNDSVSSIDEMDDSEAMAEEMSSPLDDRDERGFGTPSPAGENVEEFPGRNGRSSSPTGIHGQEAGIGVGLLAALIPAVVPGVGVVMGDGPLASDLLAEEDRAIENGVAPFLMAQGLEEPEATRFESALAAGGGILEVAAASGEASGRQVLDVLQTHNHSRYVILNVE